MTKDFKTPCLSAIDSPSKVLREMSVGEVVTVINRQRISFNGTIERMKSWSTSRFSCLKISETHFEIRRTK